MEQVAILKPVLSLMLLTALVWVYLFIRRIGYLSKHKIDAEQLKSPEQVVALLPEPINSPANNLRNLFELPVLFYALCLSLLFTAAVDNLYIYLAWGFVLFRALHSLVHCTFNNVNIRFLCYLLSSLLLWWMLIRALLTFF